MRGAIWIGWIWVMGCCMTPAESHGQNLLWNDTLVLLPLSSLAPAGTSLVRFSCYQDLSYRINFSGLFLQNWQQDPNKNNLFLQQQLKYRIQLNSGSAFRVTHLLSHDLGFQIFFDSITRFQPDENTLDTRLELKLSRSLQLIVLSYLSTRFFNCYDYVARSAGVDRYLSASFLTPLLWIFSGGLGWNLRDAIKVDVGISAAKLTYVRNKKIFSQPGRESCFGVSMDQDHRFEYGLTFHLLIDKAFLTRFHWDCDLLLFKDYHQPVDMTLKSLLAVRITRFLKTSIQTRLYFEREVSSALQIENLISVGFFVSL